MKTLFYNCQIVTENEIINGFLVTNDGIITKISKIKPIEDFDNSIDCHNYYLFPGMIDIHLHGSYNYDFINGPSDIIAKGLISEGTTSYLASLTVVSHKDTLKLLEQFDEFKQSSNTANFLGVHLEGPYLSLEKKALMDPTYLRDANETELIEMLKHPCLKVMTIAPERNNAIELIKKYHDKVNFMIGHTNCTCQQATNALDNGVKGFTHLYNAMSQHTHRNPGAVTAALNSNSYCELIVDGNHVDKDVIKVTYKTLSSNNIILITDAMLGKGMPDGEYTFSNLKCRKVKDKVNVIESGIFAGSVITQNDAIKYMKQFTNGSIIELAQMSSTNPAKLLNLNKGIIKENFDADFILLDENLDVKATFIASKQVY